MKKWVLVLVLALALVAAWGVQSFNQIQELDEHVQAQASEILNQYQRRADLIPNLVKTVQGSANFESKVLTEVTELRGQIGRLNINAADLNDAQKLQAFNQAQSQLGGAISRLLAVAESYPDVKSTQAFADLMVQLEGTENRITTARGRYIQSVQRYNSYIRKVPASWVAGYAGAEIKPNFSVENPAELSKAPSIEFN